MVPVRDEIITKPVHGLMDNHEQALRVTMRRFRYNDFLNE